MSDDSVPKHPSSSDGSAAGPLPSGRPTRERPWPIRFYVPGDQADHWHQHLRAEATAQNWAAHGIASGDGSETKGHRTLRPNAGTPGPELEVEWRRRRGRGMVVRMRPGGTPPLSLEEAEVFHQRLEERVRANALQAMYRRGLLYYRGKPWCGEAWLDATTRLGPPSRQYEPALDGPRAIVADAVVEGIDHVDACHVFEVKLRELAVFLTVLQRTPVTPQTTGQDLVWTWNLAGDGTIRCEHGVLGYHEAEYPAALPAKGSAAEVPLRATPRPCLTPDFSYCTILEETLPDDTLELWRAYAALLGDRRRQFLQAGNLYRRALMLWREDPTLGVALMAVACEALKLPGAKYDGHNMLGVVKALLGEPCARQLLDLGLPPHRVRNDHLHRGEFRGDEFVKRLLVPSFMDDTFDQTRDVMNVITAEAIIEWLRRGGVYDLPSRPWEGQRSGTGRP